MWCILYLSEKQELKKLNLFDKFFKHKELNILIIL